MTTPLDALIAALHEAAAYNAAAEAPPEAVVCDAGQEFLPLLPLLRERLPELLTYGDCEPSSRSGPSVWIRGAIARAIPGVTWSDDSVPIIYLPGLGRDVLKGAEDCPRLLQPLVWFTVAGNLFGHVNGKDWTLRGFLAADRGALRLSIADDVATRVALITLRTELEVGPGGLPGWVLDGVWFGALMERERSGRAHAAPGGSSLLTSLTNTSSKPGP